MFNIYNKLNYDLQELIKKKYFEIIKKEILEDKIIFENKYKKNYDELIERINLEIDDFEDFNEENYENIEDYINFYEYNKGMGFIYIYHIR